MDSEGDPYGLSFLSAFQHCVPVVRDWGASELRLEGAGFATRALLMSTPRWAVADWLEPRGCAEHDAVGSPSRLD